MSNREFRLVAAIQYCHGILHPLTMVFTFTCLPKPLYVPHLCAAHNGTAASPHCHCARVLRTALYLSHIHVHIYSQAHTPVSPSDAPPSPSANAFKARSLLSARGGACQRCIKHTLTRGCWHNSRRENARKRSTDGGTENEAEGFAGLLWLDQRIVSIYPSLHVPVPTPSSLMT